MKLIVLTVASLLSISAHAQSWNYDDDRRSCIDGKHSGCVSASTAAVTSAGGGIYAFRKYSQAKVFDKMNSKALLDAATNPVRLAGDRISSLTRDIVDGDRVTIQYRLSERANRQHHISEMQSAARSSESSASSYRTMAMSALIPKTETEYYTDSNGNQQSRTVTKGPDFAQHMYYQNLAADAERDAAHYHAEARAAANGGKVPWYEFDEVIGDKAGNRTTAVEFLSKNAREEGSVLKITRLPAAQFRQLKSIVWKARGGVAVAAVGGALVLEELLIGKVSHSLTAKASSSSIPTMSRGSLR